MRKIICRIMKVAILFFPNIPFLIRLYLILPLKTSYLVNILTLQLYDENDKPNMMRPFKTQYSYEWLLFIHIHQLSNKVLTKFIVFVTRLLSLLGALQLTWKSASDSVAWEKTKKIYILGELLKWIRSFRLSHAEMVVGTHYSHHDPILVFYVLSDLCKYLYCRSSELPRFKVFSHVN